MRSASAKRGTLQLVRKLRRASTEAEKRFWSKVRDRQIDGAKFRRQWPVGNFVADFCCVEQKLIVEIDGGQHAESLSDEVRTQSLEKLGYRVIRFWNNDVFTNLEGVLLTLREHLAEKPLTPR